MSRQWRAAVLPVSARSESRYPPAGSPLHRAARHRRQESKAALGWKPPLPLPPLPRSLHRKKAWHSDRHRQQMQPAAGCRTSVRMRFSSLRRSPSPRSRGRKRSSSMQERTLLPARRDGWSGSVRRSMRCCI